LRVKENLEVEVEVVGEVEMAVKVAEVVAISSPHSRLQRKERLNMKMMNF